MPKFIERLLAGLLLECATRISRRLDALEAQGVRLMSKATEMDAKLDGLKSAAIAERAEVQAAFEALRAEIANLNSGATATEMDALLLKADTLFGDIGVISDAETPAPAVP